MFRNLIRTGTLIKNVKHNGGLAAFNRALRHVPDNYIEPVLVTFQSKLNYFKGSQHNNKLRLSEASFDTLPLITMDMCNSLLFDEVNRFDTSNQPIFRNCTKLMFHNCNYQFESLVLSKKSTWNINGLDTIYTNSEYDDDITPLIQIKSVRNIFINDKNTWKMFEEYTKTTGNTILYVNDWDHMVTIRYINNITWTNAYNSQFIPCIDYEPNFNNLIQKILDTQFALKQSVKSV